MGGSSKHSTSTQAVTVPPEILARYSAVNARAEDAASKPFQTYSDDPSKFVAPLNSTQQAGVAGTNAAAGQAQPYFDAATGQLVSAQQQGLQGLGGASGTIGSSLSTLNAANQNAAPLNQQAGQYYGSAFQAAQPYNQAAGAAIGSGVAGAQPFNQQAASGLSGAYAGAQPYNQAAAGLAAASGQAVDPSQLNIGQYLSPYLGTVLGGTAGILNQQNQQQQAGQLGNAIKSGAFGGDRAGIASANLAQQQQLANSKIYSDIMNSGYSSALGAAQQQQGVGLGAAQANRAALGQAGQSLAQIGQQQYGQGTGTAQAQAQLGQQVYGQGLGAGSAIQGLGQQVYGQGTGTGSAVQGLGQQVFGQGLATSQQQLAAAQAQAQLAQQQYGMGANTSQQLAGLGTGAQGANLAGAQAQLQAGQVGQQTEQAGLTALYNQFLQQQSYPFQTAQFLANIAEGTGSLSGSTTTTTQPGGFFSDERLKEDIRKVGKTFDGQSIVTYKYKDEPNVIRMGLIAQDVEKKYPDAVGEREGFKTVDYGRATDKAAKRGHFAGGGSTLPGLDGADMNALLAAQAQMYSPYATGGLYGGQASSAPRGGSSYVPQANLPVSHLTVAGGLAPQENPLEQIKAITDLATVGGDAWDKHKKHGESAHEESYYRGGLAMASGGALPYATQTGYDIPDDKSDYQLPTPDSLGKQKSGLSQVTDAAKTALKIAAMFGAANGGRIERADGGGLDDDPEVKRWGPLYEGPSPKVVSSAPAWPFGTIEHNNQQDSGYWNVAGKSRDKAAVTPDRPETVSHAPGAATKRVSLIDQALAKLHQYDPGRVIGDYFGSDRDPGKMIGDLIGGTAHAATPAVVAAPVTHASAPSVAPHRQMTPREGGLAPPTAPALNPVADPTTVSDVAPTSSPTSVGLSVTPPDANIMPPHGPGLGERIMGSPVGGYLKGLKHGDTADWVSLLSGIGAMGTAPTVHPGVALAAGLTGGTQAYQAAKKQQAQVAQTAAETGHIGAQQRQTEADTLNRVAPPAPEGYVAAPGPGPHGEQIRGKDGSIWHFELPVNATNFGPQAAAGKVPTQPGGIAPSADTDTYVASQYKIDPSQPGVANRTRALALNPALAPVDQAANAKVQERIGNLQDAETSRRQSIQLAEAYSMLPKEGLMAQGHASDRRAFWANIYQTAANMAGIPVDPAISDATAENQIIAKIKELSGPALASQYGEKAASVSHAISGVIPSGDTSPKAAGELIAALLVQSQMAPELAQYKDAYVNRYGIMAGVEPAFQRDMAPKYAADQRALAKFIGNSHFTDALADLQSPDPQKRQIAADYVDKTFGSPIHRYFVGGQ